MGQVSRSLGLLAVCVMVFFGCVEMERSRGGGGGWGWGDPGSISRGTVVRNDARYNSMAIRTDDRREVVFYYNADTRVSYRNRDYPVRNIQPGDNITMRTRDRTAKNPMADSITVDSLGTGPGGEPRLDSLEGRVERIDGRRGTFEIRAAGNRIVYVSMPSRPSRSDADRFDRLRNGDQVRVQGRYVSGDRFELERFL